MASPVYADLVRPASPPLARVFDAAVIAGFSLLIALSAQVAIPLPFTPVPVTLQTLAIILTGCLLGSGRGALAAAAYVAEGSLGLPFFSGGTGGIAHLLGPTGGYLVGCVAAAYVAGLCGAGTDEEAGGAAVDPVCSRSRRLRPRARLAQHLHRSRQGRGPRLPALRHRGRAEDRRGVELPHGRGHDHFAGTGALGLSDTAHCVRGALELPQDVFRGVG